jgi:hypothetical protein
MEFTWHLADGVCLCFSDTSKLDPVAVQLSWPGTYTQRYAPATYRTCESTTHDMSRCLQLPLCSRRSLLRLSNRFFVQTLHGHGYARIPLKEMSYQGVQCFQLPAGRNQCRCEWGNEPRRMGNLFTRWVSTSFSKSVIKWVIARALCTGKAFYVATFNG